MNLTLRKIALKILTRVREADYNNIDSTPVAKIEAAKDVFITCYEMFSETLPKQMKSINVVTGKNATHKENFLIFSSRGESDCCNDEDSEIDYHFDILSLSHVRADFGYVDYLSYVPFHEKLYPYTYSWCVLTDRQVLKLQYFSGKMILYGRFKDFDYCDTRNLDRELNLDFRFLEPLLAICAYEYAKRFLKKADIEFLKAFADEGIAQLRKNNIGFNF